MTLSGETVVIVGGGAGGASCATRLRRLREDMNIVVLEKGEYPSIASCGLPYHISDTIRDRDDLIVTRAQRFRDRFNIDIRLKSECISVDAGRKIVLVREGPDGRVYEQSYDYLVLAPGAKPKEMPVPGLSSEEIREQTFVLRTIPDLDRIKEFISRMKPRRALVVGGSFVGLEVVENLVKAGLEVTLVEIMEQVLPTLDFEMAAFLNSELRANGVKLMLATRLVKAEVHTPPAADLPAGTKEGEDKRNLKEIVVELAGPKETLKRETDLIVFATGIKPETEFRKGRGIRTTEQGYIGVDERMQTSVKGIYALGDCALTKHYILNRPAGIPLAWPANWQGRIVAQNIAGRPSEHDGFLGTCIIKVFELTAAATGASERMLCRYNEEKQKGGCPHETIDYTVSYTHHPHHATYYPGYSNLSTKLLFESRTGKILGAQIVGKKGVDKRIDVLVTAIYGGLTVEELGDLELAYAPPYSSARDPVNQAGYVAANIMRKEMPILHWYELDEFAKSPSSYIIDVRTEREYAQGHHPAAVNIPLDQFRAKINQLPPDKNILLICRSGQRSYNAQRILLNRGFRSVRNLSGGWLTYTTAMGEKMRNS
ncbi:MAG: FAD-dependent oxidoreductase [Thermoplasmata archaeon]